METYTAEQVLAPSNSALFEEIVSLLTQSFMEDPGTKFVFNKHTKAETLVSSPHYHRILFKLALLAGASVIIQKNEKPITRPNPSTDTTTTKTAREKQNPIRLPATPTISALAVLIPPKGNAAFESAWNFFRAGILKLPFQTGFTSFYKILTEIAPNMTAMQERVFPRSSGLGHHSFWHLLFVAVHPDCQGQGLGKTILCEVQRVVEEAEEGNKEKACVYLESSTRGSQRLYRRVGFVDRDVARFGEAIATKEDVSMRESDGKTTGFTAFGMTWTL